MHLVLQSGHGAPPGAPVDTPGVEGGNDQALGADAERVALDDKLHHLGREEQEVLAAEQLLCVDVDGLETGEGELLEQLVNLIRVIVLVISSFRIVLTLSPLS